MKTSQTATDGKTTINDMRGAGYSANVITIHDNAPFYAGMKISELLLIEHPRNKHQYSIRSHGTQLGTISLTDANAQKVKSLIVKEIDFTRVNSDANGNPRYVCHFLNLINAGDKLKADTRGIGFVSHEYELALIKAQTIGGRKFHNKQYGGGIVFQSYSTNETQEAVNRVREVNTNFVKEFAPKDFKKIERAITKFFQNYTFKVITDHSKPAEKMSLQQSYNFEALDNLLGFAYTSSGYCAEYGICNGVYVMANETHHFDSFMINELGQVVAQVQDENEKTIYIQLP